MTATLQAAPQATPQAPVYLELFDRGTRVLLCDGSGTQGYYQGNAGKRWNGAKHRVRLLDGRNRYVEGCWIARSFRRTSVELRHVGGLLWAWCPVEEV